MLRRLISCGVETTPNRMARSSLFSLGCCNNNNVRSFSTHSPVLLATGTPEWFKQKKLKSIKERERRALERAGVDVDADGDDEPWVDPEEQARLDAEKAEQERIQREKEEEMRAKRDKLDAEKKKKFKKFRAQQLSISKQQRQERDAEGDSEGKSGAGRTLVKEVAEPKGVEKKEPVVEAAAADGATTDDADPSAASKQS